MPSLVSAGRFSDQNSRSVNAKSGHAAGKKAAMQEGEDEQFGNRVETDSVVRRNGFPRLADSAGIADYPGPAGGCSCVGYGGAGVAAGVGTDRCRRARMGTGGKLFSARRHPGGQSSARAESDSSGCDTRPVRGACCGGFPCAA